MTTNIFSFPKFSKALVEAATQAAGFILSAADAIYGAIFHRVLRSIVRTI